MTDRTDPQFNGTETLTPGWSGNGWRLLHDSERIQLGDEYQEVESPYWRKPDGLVMATVSEWNEHSRVNAQAEGRSTFVTLLWRRRLGGGNNVG